jgi:hypothetical protein
MLSKCANPECSKTLRYLHQGKIFCLAPTPEVETVMGELNPEMQERFWLCDECSKIMTLVWGGATVRLVPLPFQGRRSTVPDSPVRNNENHPLKRKRPGSGAVYVSREEK